MPTQESGVELLVIVILNMAMQSVIMLNIVVLSVVAPLEAQNS